MAVTEGKGQKKPLPSGRKENAFSGRQMGLVKKGDSCSFMHSRASGNQTSAEEVKNTGKRQAPSSVPTGKGQTDVKSSTSREASPATGAKIPCLWGARCKRSSCDFRHPPVCRDYKSGKRCIYGNSCLYRHLMVRRNPARSRRKRVLKEQLRF